MLVGQKKKPLRHGPRTIRRHHVAELSAFVFAFALSYAGTQVLLRSRMGRQFIDVPNERSSHAVPKPRYGGIALVSSFFLVFLSLAWLRPDMLRFWPLVAGGLIIFVAGVVDDWRSLPVAVRFVAQVLAAIIVVASGHVVRELTLPMVEPIHLGAMAVPLTVLFILASINFYNFIDGIDGLAAGTATIASGFLAAVAFMLGHGALGLVCLAVAGSSAGFLQFNFPPSRVFMGDSGSTFLGFFFAYVAVSACSLSPQVPFFIPVLMLSSLYLDAVLTLIRRAFRGQKILQPHRTHYYQRLLALGLNHKQVTLLEYGLTILLGVSAILFFKAGGFFPVFVTLCWVVVFTALILKIQGLERGDRFFWERRTLLVIGIDLSLIALAYFGAYFLRMGFRFTEAEGMATIKAFPIVLVVRSACFYAYGLYRGMWKYTSTADVLKIIKAVTAGSAIIVMLLVMFYRFIAFPRSLFVIEYFLLILALAGCRFAARLFHEFGKEALGSDARRVAIVGAGDYGERLRREIRGTEGHAVNVVCYVDDDREKIGLTVHGVPILGPIEDLAQICSSRSVDTVVIGVRSLPHERVKLVLQSARDAGVSIQTGARTEDGPAGVAGLPVLDFDRLSRALGRKFSTSVEGSEADTYRNRRVLVTNGGETIGPALVGELLSLGAEVVVQVESEWEVTRFADERVSFVLSPFDKEIDVDKTMAAAEPDVVLHCVALSAVSSLNADEYLWRRIVRSARAISRVLPSYPVESMVHCSFWDDVDVGDRSAALCAAAETTLLNSAELLSASPKMIRLRSVLGYSEVEKVLAGEHGAVESEKTYQMNELEAVAFCLGVAAKCTGRAIIVPRGGCSFTSRDVGNILGRKTRSGPPALVLETAAGPVFPVETLKPSVVTWAREVVGPLYPATDVLRGYVSQCHLDPSPETLSQPLRLLRTVLFERLPHVSIE